MWSILNDTPGGAIERRQPSQPARAARPGGLDTAEAAVAAGRGLGEVVSSAVSGVGLVLFGFGRVVARWPAPSLVAGTTVAAGVWMGWLGAGMAGAFWLGLSWLLLSKAPEALRAGVDRLGVKPVDPTRPRRSPGTLSDPVMPAQAPGHQTGDLHGQRRAVRVGWDPETGQPVYVTTETPDLLGDAPQVIDLDPQPTEGVTF